MAPVLKRLHITWHGLLIYLLLVVLLFLHYQKLNRRKKMTIINDIGKDLYLRLIENGFNLNMSRFLTAQAAHETGNFTSTIFKNNHNLFGMKLPRVRQTTAIGSSKGHAVYASIEDSIKDMALYLKSMGYLASYTTIAAYVKELKVKNYFEDSAENYETGMNHFYKLYFNEPGL